MSLSVQKLLAVISEHKDSRVVGRKRLQKTVYLLKRLGYPVDYDYTLFFYGPYSEDLHVEVGLLEQYGLVKEDRTSIHGVEAYVVRVADGEARELADLKAIEPYKLALDRMASTEATILELAATFETFRELGYEPAEALEATKEKKGGKATGDNLEKALRLLRELGLVKAGELPDVA